MPNQLLVELYWGNVRHHARAFSTERELHGALDDRAAVPLWGFEVGAGPVRLAERAGEGWRVFTPPGAAVERSTRGDRFHRCALADAFLLSGRDAVRFSSGPTTLVASMRPATGWLPPRRMPAGLVFTLRLVALLLGGLGTFAYSAPSLEEAVGEEPYGARRLAVRLLVDPPGSWHRGLTSPPWPRRKPNWGCRCAPPRPPRVYRAVGPVRAIVNSGEVERGLINREIGAHLKQVNACLQRVDAVTVDWSIGRQGQVDWAHAKAKAWPSSDETRAAEKCLASAVRGWQFAALQGRPTRVTASFTARTVSLGRICIWPLGPCLCPAD